MTTLDPGITGRHPPIKEPKPPLKKPRSRGRPVRKRARPQKARAPPEALRQSSEKAIERRPGRREVVRARRAASAMATVEDLARALGIGRNQAYELVQQRKIAAMRFGRRWLIPRATIAKLVSGEVTITL
jgi:excisionase family DNA binding protein